MPHRDEWAAAIAEWLTWLAAGGRPHTTLGLRAYHLRRAARELRVHPWTVTTDMLAAALARPGWAPEYRRSIRASLVSFYSWAQDSGRCPNNPARLLPTVPVPPAAPRPAPEAVLRQALERADPRTLLMIALGAFAGLRRGEIAGVHSDDLQQARDGWVLWVRGKGGRARQVPLPEALAGQIRRAVPAGGGYLFPGQIDGHLSPAHVGKLISRALPDPWTAHTLRHRFATAAYRADRDLIAVQQLLGHASVATTQRYTALPDDALRRAVLGAVA